MKKIQIINISLLSIIEGHLNAPLNIQKHKRTKIRNMNLHFTIQFYLMAILMGHDSFYWRDICGRVGGKQNQINSRKSSMKGGIKDVKILIPSSFSKSQSPFNLRPSVIIFEASNDFVKRPSIEISLYFSYKYKNS